MEAIKVALLLFFEEKENIVEMIMQRAGPGYGFQNIFLLLSKPYKAIN